jgi:ATP-binding cassette, subfamily B, bacterial
MKLKFINQLESNDCGPACLAMVSNYYGHKIDLKRTKEVCEITRMGVSVQDILKGGNKLGFSSHGLKLTISELSQIPLPAVLFWKQDHYVVLHKITQKKRCKFYHIADPGYGMTVVEEELFVKEWIGNNVKGVCLAFQVTEKFIITNDLKKDSQYKSSALIKHFSEFVKKNKVKYLLALTLLIIGLTSNWLIPIIFQKVIDNGVLEKSLNLVFALLLAQFFLFFGNFCSRLFSDYLLTKFNFELSIMLKESFLFKLIKLPISYFDTRLNTDTLLRLSDLTKMQSFLTWKGIGFLINTLNLLAFSLILLYLNATVFSIYLVLSVLSIFWIALFLKRRAVLEYSMFIRQSENSNNLYEFIMNMPEIKVNQAQNTIISRITSLQDKLNKLELRSLYLNMYQLSGANFILKLKELMVIALCAYFIINEQMSVGALLSISYIMGQLSAPIINLINNIQDIQDAKISNERVEDVYSIRNEEDRLPRAVSRKFEIDDISLTDVSFKYPGSFNPFVLKNLSFTIPKNKVTAIVGTSGSGKTTLMKLLMRYYHPNNGCIFLGDHDFEKLPLDAWREKCGVVLQDGHIFSGSIKYNITLCENDLVSNEHLDRAIRVACLDQFIESLPLGIETKIGNIGIPLSGGQNQRILIARAVYKNPEFIFFDEATSSLDANTERSILNNLTEFFKGRTVVVVAHRLSTVKNADQIIVMEAGQIIEFGSHKELINVKDKYYSLVKNQLELGN